MRKITTAAFLGLLPVLADAQPSELVTRESGGTMTVPLGFGIALNKNSTLERERVGVRHSGFPAEIVGAPSITCAYASGDKYSRGEYVYRGPVDVLVREPLAAIEVRVLLFDVWGEHAETLRAVEVADIPAGTSTFKDWGWREWSENECSEQWASITYVARVRTKDGRVIAADPGPVLTEARRFSRKMTAEALEPKPLQPPGK